MPSLLTLWRFSRPHTIIGTSLSVLALWLLNHPSPQPASLLPLLGTWITCLGGNLYIVGLNQLEDIALDRINKPQLPLAAGTLTPLQGRWTISLSASLALTIAVLQGPWLLATLLLSLLLGSAYSLPPLRLKRSALWASLCILIVRGLLVNLCLFQHFSQVLDPQAPVYTPFSPEILSLSVFIIIFSLGIAFGKDIPDLEGDRRYNIATLTVHLGAQTVFNWVRGILLLCYGTTIAIALGGVLPGRSIVWIAVHLGIAGLFWGRSQGVDVGDRASIAQFYQFIWKLFFLEYLMFPVLTWT
ncbi:MAG: homogentisate phytyltransferase [Prochlorothrix sp.]